MVHDIINHSNRNHTAPKTTHHKLSTTTNGDGNLSPGLRHVQYCWWGYYEIIYNRSMISKVDVLNIQIRQGDSTNLWIVNSFQGFHVYFHIVVYTFMRSYDEPIQSNNDKICNLTIQCKSKTARDKVAESNNRASKPW